MRRTIAGLVAIGMFVVACSSDDNGDSSGSVPAGTTETTPDGSGPSAETTDAGSDTTVAVGNEDIVPAMGIDGTTIKIVIPAKLEACGDSEAIANANILSEGGRGVIDEYVGFFNDEVLAESGFTIQHEYVDDGGIYCPEKARAAGRQIVEEIQPFAVIGDSQNLDQGPIVADMVTAAGIRHIGLSWNTISGFEERSPYAWPITHIADAAMANLVDYIDVRVRDRAGRDPESGAEVADRHYGMVTIDLPEYHEIADNVAANMESIGLELEQTYFLSTDPAIAGQNAATLVSKMASDGINTLIFDFFNLSGAASGSTLTQTMAAQNYRPDILVSTKGLAAIFGPLWEPTVWENAEGITYFSPLAARAALELREDGTYGYEAQWADINENVDPVVDIWGHLGHTDDVNVSAGTSIHNIVFGLGLLSLGILYHGEGELTADSWTDGLSSTAIGQPNRCAMGRFYGGRDTDFTPKISVARDDFDGAIDTFTTVHWVSQPTAIGLPGYWESYDNYKYVESMSELPAEPSHDTSVTPADIPLQEKVGLHAWTTCEEVGLQ